MANVIINEANLTAIGDALRNKLGATKTFNGTMVMECVPRISKSPNATGMNQYGDGTDIGTNQHFIDVVTIPNATRLKITFSYRTTHQTPTNYLAIKSGAATDVDDFRTADEYYSDSSYKTATTYFSGNTVSFLYATGTFVGEDNYGYYAEVVAVDANGDVAEIEQTFENLVVANTFKPREMASAINSIPTGSGGGEFNFTGSISYLNYNGNWDSVLFNPAYQVSFRDITSMSYAFYGNKAETIPYTFNVIYDSNVQFGSYAFDDSKIITNPVIKGTTGGYIAGMFSGCRQMKTFKAPEEWKIRGTINFNQFFRYAERLETIEGRLHSDSSDPAYLNSSQRAFDGCYKLRSIPKDFFSEINEGNLSTSASIDSMFISCYSLRSLPDINRFQRRSYKGYQSTYLCCLTADEITNVGVYTAGSRTSNMFSETFNLCARAKDILFERDSNNMPITATWSNQTIDLSYCVGYVNDNYASYITQYTGLTDATRGVFQSSSSTPHSQYNAIKDDPDFWTSDVGYSRYNHTSAFRTIQSLPNVTSGSGNTIKFKRLSGNYTAEGGVGDLTESEIGIAVVKGWTVSFVD